MTRSNDCCKSYTFHAEGGTLTLSESASRLSIEVMVNNGGIAKSIKLTRAQFKQLCDLDSSYDGLAVEDPPEPEEEEPHELDEADHDVISA